jgi:hypothetical protein
VASRQNIWIIATRLTTGSARSTTILPEEYCPRHRPVPASVR